VLALCAFALAGPCHAQEVVADAPSLDAGFVDPPHAYKPHTWWHWMNGHVTREGITRDLEDMKRIGIGGFTLWNTQEGTPPGPVTYASEEWWALLDHTMREAGRLGLEMGMFNGSGWSSTGAAFVTPDKAMQEVAWTETEIRGPGTVKRKLPVPRAALGIERDMKKDPLINRRYYMPRETVEGWFRDIAVFAVPSLPDGEKPWRLREWREKAGFGKLVDRFAPDLREAPPGQVIPEEKLIDVSRFMSEDGVLDWEAPPGSWTILRMGYQPTGRSNHPASEGGKGLEIDKMSTAALDSYWEGFLDRVVATAGPRIGQTFSTICLDSYEVGHQNWNKDFAESFQAAMGYDIRRYLPVITGRVVESPEFTERVLWDFRKVIGGKIANNYFGHMAKRARAAGLLFGTEPYGSFGNTSDPEVAALTDVPTCEWWAYDTRQIGRPAEAKVAASAAHLHGRDLVDSEAFTGTPERIFETYPGGIKTQGDGFMTLGVNRFSFHTWAHDPYGIVPGLGLGTYGSRFDNRNTWWPYAKPWHEYLARCSFLLRQGKFVGDVIYYSGDEAPLRSEAMLRERILPGLPDGIDYAIAGPGDLRKLQVRDGRLYMENGPEFRLLVLPDIPWMSVDDLKVISRLVAEVAAVSGRRPLSPPGRITPEVLKEFDPLVSTLWGKPGEPEATERRIGKGVVYQETPIHQVLAKQGVLEDFTYQNRGKMAAGKGGGKIGFIHRRTPSEEIYFLANPDPVERSISARFRVAGKVPELWLPDSGTMHRLVHESRTDGHISIALSFSPGEAFFVIFREAARAGAKLPPPWESPWRQTMDLSRDWTLGFPGDGDVKMPQLESWTTLDDDDLRHHSGTVIYQKSFSFEPGSEPVRYAIDLGEVQVIASVRLNDQDCGIAWKKPWQIDVTKALKPGPNTLEIRVANLWVNRIIGDQKHPDDVEWTTETGSTAAGRGLARIPDWVKQGGPRPNPDRKAFYGWEWPHMTKDRPLLPSGLLGPVRLLVRDAD
jgi:hypothetical protein